ncbi:MAG: indolepyruvate ferredoxin oxidoreductase subunit alpha [candidate division WS1 bacterium]|jgi:indolepyruvate ferredoxin oxidoreductase alpha subunit|nr:indolepyruvate ferredoxin oxidoreductase subunit alpha [candidate division WS1 bacterium]
MADTAKDRREKLLLSGNEAIAHGAWEAGVRFGSGYPGTPSSEILPALNELGEVYCEWSVNEKVALEAAAGASIAGARCLVTMKHVGVNVAADPLFTMSYTGVEGGLVIISADDPSMHSSQNEQDNRHYARASKVPMLEPSDSQEARDFTMRAFELSEQFDTPVFLRPVTRICHSDGLVEVGERAEVPLRGELQKQPEKYVMIPAYARKRRVFMAERTRALVELAEHDEINREEMGDTSLGIITSGAAYTYAKEAFPEASFLKLGLVWPLSPERIRRFAEQVDRLFVIEELDPFLTEEILAMGVAVERVDESFRIGELTPARVREMIAGEPAPDTTADEDLPPRPPTLCAGCPHRSVFTLLRKLKAYVTGDIGCYTLGTLPPLQALHTCLCMGAGINEAHGMQKVRGHEAPVVAVIGDSTFTHSGITGLVNIAYNAGVSTVVIVDNRTTAMTGGQVHPGVGETLSGMPGRALDFEALARAVGVEDVRVVDPYDMAATEAALRETMASPEPSVVIARRECVLMVRERRPAPDFDADRCTRCGACIRIGCPALWAEDDGGKRPIPRINTALCTGCLMCAQVCPVDALKAPEGAQEGNQ